MNQAELDKVMKEMAEVDEGKRGWACVNKARARRIGISHELLLGAARALGLAVKPHGRIGWSASRP